MNPPIPFCPFLSARLRNLISGRVQNHAWMIIVFFHHVPHILLPMCRKIICIVMGILCPSPHITQFIHHQHPQLITGIQHCLTHRMMCTSKSVKSGFLQLAATPILRIWKCCRSDNPIIMVNTSPPQFRWFTVHQQTMFCIQPKCTDSC